MTLLLTSRGSLFGSSISKKWTKAIVDPDGAPPAPWRSALLFQIAGRKCSTRTDHYRGVLAILRHHESIVRTNEVAAGQSRDATAYRSLCLDLIDFSGTLDFLAFLSSERPNDAPSWVVQWHEADSSWARQLHLSSDSAITRSKPWYRWTPASGSELRVLGVPIARVASAMSYRIAPRTLEQLRLDSNLDELECFHDRRPTVRGWDSTETDLPGINCGTWVKGSYAMVPERLPSAVVHGKAQTDDVVFLLSGLSLPIILRKVRRGLDCSFQVVGTAYLSNAMRGEMWTEDVQSKLREITLV